MSRYVQPYKGARVEAMASGVLAEGPNTGAQVTITLYRDVASHGTRPIRWYEVVAPTIACDGRKSFRQCWSFSGRKFAEAAHIFARDVAAMALTVNITLADAERVSSQG